MRYVGGGVDEPQAGASRTGTKSKAGAGSLPSAQKKAMQGKKSLGYA